MSNSACRTLFFFCLFFYTAHIQVIAGRETTECSKACCALFIYIFSARIHVIPGKEDVSKTVALAVNHPPNDDTALSPSHHHHPPPKPQNIPNSRSANTGLYSKLHFKQQLLLCSPFVIASAGDCPHPRRTVYQQNTGPFCKPHSKQTSLASPLFVRAKACYILHPRKYVNKQTKKSLGVNSNSSSYYRCASYSGFVPVRYRQA